MMRKKDFFFEKKKQKTFENQARLSASGAKSQKFFGSFFQKRTASFLPKANQPDHSADGLHSVR